MDRRFDTAMREVEYNAGIPYSEIFDYRDGEKALLFDRYNSFCQTNLTGHSTEFEIQPALFYYSPDQRINARAKQRNGYFLIEVFAGLVIKLYDHFYETNRAFEIDKVLRENYAPLLPSDTPPGYLMYQAAIQFTYYHERAHLIQRSPLLSQALDEEYAHGTSTMFDFSRHLLEFDADMHAAHFVCFHMIDYWKKLPVEKQTLSAITSLLALAASSIFTFFVFLEGGETPIYYQDKRHPHPVVRISYVIDILSAVAEQNLAGTGLKAGDVLKEAFDISERMAIANGRTNPIYRYAALFKAEHKNITDYIQVLIDESEKVANLVKNRVT